MVRRTWEEERQAQRDYADECDYEAYRRGLRIDPMIDKIYDDYWEGLTPEESVARYARDMRDARERREMEENYWNELWQAEAESERSEL